MPLKRSLRLFPNSLNVKRRQLQGQFSIRQIPVKPVGLITLVILVLLFLNQVFRVKKIDCTTDNISCPEELIGFFQPLKDQLYFGLQTDFLTESIINKFPVGTVSYSFKFPQKLQVKITDWQNFVPVSVFQINPLPSLSLDSAYQTSQSAQWQKPSLELITALTELTPQYTKLWSNGLQNPDSTTSAEVIEIYSETPTQEALSHFYHLIDLAHKYLESPKPILFGNRVLLSQTNQPDIIIYIPTDLARVESALQSIGKIYTIKQDAKVIDLSFKHPILK